MSDYRNQLLQSIEESLSTVLEPGVLRDVSSKIICVLNDYEVTKRCTDLIVYDDVNERIIKRYCACLKVDGKAESTINVYARSIRLFSEFVAKPLPEVGVYDIRFYLVESKERGVSDRSIENIRSYIATFYQWMTAEEIISKNPCDNIKPIKYKDVERLPFSSVEIDELRRACTTMKERAIFEMLLTSGVRVSELTKMDVLDIDFGKLSVHVKHGKGGKERFTYINDVARQHIKKYVQNRAYPSSALICNRNGNRIDPSGVRFILKKIGARAGVDNVHPHRFRRTFATGLASRGMAIQDIQKLLGHTNINTTLQYVSIDDTRVHNNYRQYIA